MELTELDMAWFSSLFGSKKSESWLTDDAAWGNPYGFFSFKKTNAGEDVTPYSAFTYSAVWCATQRRCGTLGSLPKNLYKRGENNVTGLREKVIHYDHPIQRLLHDQANPEMGACAFHSYMEEKRLNNGNAYAEIQWELVDGKRVPYYLWPIHPSRVKVLRADTDNRVIYEVTNKVKKPDDVPVSYVESEDMIHLTSLMMKNPLEGMGVIEFARETIGFGLATERHGAKTFGSGTMPKAVLTNATEKMSNPDTRKAFRSDWREVHQQDGFDIAILNPGQDIKPLTLSVKDQQFLECCVPETMILLSDGTQKRVDQLTISDSLFGWDQASDKLVPSKIEAIRDNGVHPLIRVTTHRGRTLVTTRNHPYLGSKKTKRFKSGQAPKHDERRMSSTWIRADELSVGDYVRAGLRYGNQEALFVPTEEAWYVGAMIGDGYCRGKKSIGFSNISQGNLNKMRLYCESLGVVMKQKVTSDVDHYFVGRDDDQYQESTVRNILKPYGVLGTLAHTKCVPEKIEKSQPEARLAFIAGLWDTDGTVGKPEKSQPTVSYATVSRKLADGVQRILASVNIQSSVYQVTDAGQKMINGQMCNTRDSYHVTVCGRSEVKRFAETVRPFMAEERKVARLEVIAGDQGRAEHPDYCEFDRIVKIEELPAAQTIALTVAGTHSHVTNGLITHNTRQHNIEEICRWYDLPPHTLHHLLRATNNNIEEMSIGLVVYSLVPWIVPNEQHYLYKLMPDEEERKLHYLKWEVNGLMRGNSAARASFYHAGITDGWLSPNDATELEDFNPFPGGDQHFIQGAMAPIREDGSLGETMSMQNVPDTNDNDEPQTTNLPQTATVTEPMVTVPPKPTADEPSTTSGVIGMAKFKLVARTVLEDCLKRMVHKEATAARRAAKNPSGWLAWLDEFYAAHAETMGTALVLPMEACSHFGVPNEPATFGRDLANGSKRRLLDLSGEVTPDQFAAAVDSLMNDWERDRAANCVRGIEQLN